MTSRATLLVISTTAWCVVASPVLAQGTGGGGTAIDKKTGLTWQRAPVPNLDYAGAVAYCRNLDLGGSTGWRLPTERELTAAYDLLPTEPGYDAGRTFMLWSSTETPGGRVKLAFRNLNSQGTLEREKTWKPAGASVGARCVRSSK
jgi:hypothetical protein